jgi:histidine decarboxylase
MLNRRSFLASTGLLAGASSVGLCRPVFAGMPTERRVPATADLAQRQFLKWRKDNYAEYGPEVFLGYPVSFKPVSEGFLAWREELRRSGIGELPSNNVGDPFETPLSFTTHPLERDLIRRFGKRYGFPEDDTWGFLSHSGTDSNMHGVYIGRTLLKQRTGVLPRIYYTDEAHYSIQIIRDLLGLEEVLIETNSDASMNMADLEQKLAQNRDAPVLLVATIGTTFKGGIDDIDAINARLKGRDTWLHLDAALFGGYMQVSPFAGELARVSGGVKRYDSLAVSCHKFFGFPSPAGLFLVGNRDFQEYRTFFEKVHDPAYISHVPGTITCSRDAVKSAEFHYYCTEDSLREQQREAKAILEDAHYLHGEMKRHFPELNPKIVSERSNTVYFNNAISDGVKKKWTLATIRGSEEKGPSLAHAVVMQHADRGVLDQFLSDLQQDRKSSGGSFPTG